MATHVSSGWVFLPPFFTRSSKFPYIIIIIREISSFGWSRFSTPICSKFPHFDAKMLKFSSFILSKISITQKDFRGKATPSWRIFVRFGVKCTNFSDIPWLPLEIHEINAKSCWKLSKTFIKRSKSTKNLQKMQWKQKLKKFFGELHPSPAQNGWRIWICRQRQSIHEKRQ